MGCSPPHLTLRRRHGSHEKALFLVARAELVVVWLVVLLLPLLLLFPLPLFPVPLEVALDADAILVHGPSDLPQEEGDGGLKEGGGGGVVKQQAGRGREGGGGTIS